MYNDLIIVINTLGRVNKQITWDNLTPEIREITSLSVQEHEANQYDGKYDLLVLPDSIRDLPATRQHLLDKIGCRYLIIMDDDLSFFRRAKEGTDHKHLLKITPEQTTQMFKDIYFYLKTGYPMVGISSREGNNRVEEPRKLIGRSMRIFGLDLETVRRTGARFDRTKSKEDMDMTLQLLRAGYKNMVLYDYANDHVSSNAPGGCALYRTLELMEKDAYVFQALHPNFVKVVKKQTKTSWNGQERTDVIVQWKKAYLSSPQLHGAP